MTPWRAHHLALMLCLIAVVIGGATALPPVDSAAIFPPSSLETPLLVHCSHNGFSSWPTLFLPLKVGDNYVPALALATLTLGMVVFMQMLYPLRSPLSIALGTSSIIAVALVTFGSNHMLITGSAFVPWLSASLLLYRRAPSPFSIIISCASAAALALNAHQLTIPLVVLCGVLASVCPAKNRDNRFGATLTAILIATSVLAISTTPYPEMPEYPYGSRVVADDDLAGDPRPHVGREYPLRPVDRSVLRERYQSLSIVSSVVSALAWLATPTLRGLAGISFGLSMVATLDTVPHEMLAQLSPLQTLARVIPGGVLIPFVEAALFAALLTIGLVGFGLSWPRRCLIMVAIGLSAACSVREGAVTINASLPLLSARDGCAGLSRSTLPRDRLLSPSYSILNRQGDFVAKPFEQLSTVPAEQLRLSVAASNHTELIPMLLDSSHDTRWTSGNGRQSGGEWLLLQTENPISLGGVQLHLGPFGTDYPRGLKVSVAEQCPDGRRSPFDTVFFEPRWRGAIRQLADGTPFFEAEQVIRARWATRQSTRCILLEQVDRTTHFDWSVTGIDLFISSTSEAP